MNYSYSTSVGSCDGSGRVFGYQHVGIGNAKWYGYIRGPMSGREGGTDWTIYIYLYLYIYLYISIYVYMYMYIDIDI